MGGPAKERGEKAQKKPEPGEQQPTQLNQVGQGALGEGPTADAAPAAHPVGSDSKPPTDTSGGWRSWPTEDEEKIAFESKPHPELRNVPPLETGDVSIELNLDDIESKIRQRHQPEIDERNRAREREQKQREHQKRHDKVHQIDQQSVDLAQEMIQNPAERKRLAPKLEHLETQRDLVLRQDFREYGAGRTLEPDSQQGTDSGSSARHDPKKDDRDREATKERGGKDEFEDNWQIGTSGGHDIVVANGVLNGHRKELDQVVDWMIRRPGEFHLWTLWEGEPIRTDVELKAFRDTQGIVDRMHYLNDPGALPEFRAGHMQEGPGQIEKALKLLDRSGMLPGGKVDNVVVVTRQFIYRHDGQGRFTGADSYEGSAPATNLPEGVYLLQKGSNKVFDVATGRDIGTWGTVGPRNLVSDTRQRTFNVYYDSPADVLDLRDQTTLFVVPPRSELFSSRGSLEKVETAILLSARHFSKDAMRNLAAMGKDPVAIATTLAGPKLGVVGILAGVQGNAAIAEEFGKGIALAIRAETPQAIDDAAQLIADASSQYVIGKVAGGLVEAGYRAHAAAKAPLETGAALRVESGEVHPPVEPEPAAPAQERGRARPPTPEPQVRPAPQERTPRAPQPKPRERESGPAASEEKGPPGHGDAPPPPEKPKPREHAATAREPRSDGMLTDREFNAFTSAFMEAYASFSSPDVPKALRADVKRYVQGMELSGKASRMGPHGRLNDIDATILGETPDLGRIESILRKTKEGELLTLEDGKVLDQYEAGHAARTAFKEKLDACYREKTGRSLAQDEIQVWTEYGTMSPEGYKPGPGLDYLHTLEAKKILRIVGDSLKSMEVGTVVGKWNGAESVRGIAGESARKYPHDRKAKWVSRVGRALAREEVPLPRAEQDLVAKAFRIEMLGTKENLPTAEASDFIRKYTKFGLPSTPSPRSRAPARRR